MEEIKLHYNESIIIPVGEALTPNAEPLRISYGGLKVILGGTLADRAYHALVESEIIPAEQIGINSVLHADWDGESRVILSEGVAEPEDETQLGILSQLTPLVVTVLSRDRDAAGSLCKTAADIVYRAFEKQERIKGSGIWSIVKKQFSITNIPDRTEFEAFWSFNVLNYINI